MDEIKEPIGCLLWIIVVIVVWLLLGYGEKIMTKIFGGC